MYNAVDIKVYEEQPNVAGMLHISCADLECYVSEKGLRVAKYPSYELEGDVDFIAGLIAKLDTAVKWGYDVYQLGVYESSEGITGISVRPEMPNVSTNPGRTYYYTNITFASGITLDNLKTFIKGLHEMFTYIQQKTSEED